MKFIYLKDDAVPRELCEQIIEEYRDKTTPLSAEFEYVGYQKYDFRAGDKYINDVVECVKQASKEYTERVPEFETIGKWKLQHLRFKHFKPGDWFSNFHSEHGPRFPWRITNVQIYLSDHNCGTEFYNGLTIQSRKGRIAIWPSYFTHAHRGQPCPDNKDRYIIGGYHEFCV